MSMKNMMERSYWTWQKLAGVIGTIAGLFAIVGGVFGANKYMQTTYMENEDAEHIVEMLELSDEDIKQYVVMNQKSIQLQNYRLEQKIIQDRIDRKMDLKDRLEIKQSNAPAPQQMEIKEQINEVDRDIRVLERDLDSIDKPE